MKTLPTAFKKQGWEHEQVHRDGNLAIFKRWKEGGLPPHYEVIKVQSHNGLRMGGADIPPSEFYPNGGSWGSQGWTLHSMEEAMNKLNQFQAP